MYQFLVEKRPYLKNAKFIIHSFQLIFSVNFFLVGDTLENPGVTRKLQNRKYDFSFFHENGSNCEGGGGGLHILSREKSKLSQVWTNIHLDYLQNLLEPMSNRMKQSKM